MVRKDLRRITSKVQIRQRRAGTAHRSDDGEEANWRRVDVESKKQKSATKQAASLVRQLEPDPRDRANKTHAEEEPHLEERVHQDLRNCMASKAQGFSVYCQLCST